MPAPQTIRISLPAAQALAVHKQGLALRPAKTGRADLLRTVRQIGLLQLDTIHVVARSHYLVMLSRVGLYEPQDLDALLYPERALFEQWAHAACLIPIEDYPYFAPVIWARRERLNGRLSRLGTSPQAVLRDVLDRVTASGPLRSVDFEDPRANPGTWWDWKPAKIALEILFEEGYLMIDRRVNFQRYYDLASRVLPASAQPPALSVADFRRWATRQSIAHLGVATARQIADYYRQLRAPVNDVIRTLLAEGQILAAEVVGWQEPAYVCPDDLPLLKDLASGRAVPQVTALLSPFDNLIWDRARLQALFDFHYRIEVYTPLASKERRYGYYVMPILHHGRLVGRLDPKADRRAHALILHAVYLEPGVVPDDELVVALATAIREFAEFHRCTTIRIDRSDPPELRDLLLRECG